MSGPAGDVAGALVQALGPGSGIGVAVQDLLALGHDIARLRPAAEGDERHLGRVRDGLARAVSQIREVMLDLHPVQLQVGGLDSVGRRDELVLSLARELLRNAGKHARAGFVDVSVALEEGVVRLDVVDDGVGLAQDRLPEGLGSGHIGLASSRERAEAIGGSFRVGPRDDGQPGTQAVALLP